MQWQKIISQQLVVFFYGYLTELKHFWSEKTDCIQSGHDDNHIATGLSVCHF